MTRLVEVTLFYLALIILLAFAGTKTRYGSSDGAKYGAALGVVVSLILWYSYGKEYVAEDPAAKTTTVREYQLSNYQENRE